MQEQSSRSSRNSTSLTKSLNPPCLASSQLLSALPQISPPHRVALLQLCDGSSLILNPEPQSPALGWEFSAMLYLQLEVFLSAPCRDCITDACQIPLPKSSALANLWEQNFVVCIHSESCITFAPVTRLKAAPFLPNLPLRPILWRYVSKAGVTESLSTGTMKLITRLTWNREGTDELEAASKLSLWDNEYECCVEDLMPPCASNLDKLDLRRTSERKCWFH